MLENRGEVLGEGVVVVADGGLARLAKAAAVIGDDAVSGLQQDTFLLLPGVSVQWVSVDQDDRLPGAVILVVDVDVVGVFLANGDRGHMGPFRSGDARGPCDERSRLWLAELIAVICSADIGQGACGTEELLSALRRFAYRTSCRWPNPACAVCGVRVRGLTHGTSATARDG